jgi:branched-subunit amino acid transport protein
MTNTPLVIAGMAVLSAGTYAFRLAGQTLKSRIRFPAEASKLLETAAVVMLAALVATTALTATTLSQGHGFAAPARPLGVLVGGVLAWRKAPFLVIVIAAAATTAVLRLAGVP